MILIYRMDEITYRGKIKNSRYDLRNYFLNVEFRCKDTSKLETVKEGPVM